MMRAFGLVAFVALSVATVTLSNPVRAADLGDALSSEPNAFDPIFVPQRRWYTGIRGGAAFTQDTEFRTLGTKVKNSYKDPAYYVGGFVGYNFSTYGVPGLRGELELAYTSASINSQTLGGTKFTGGAAFGDVNTWLGLASLYYDFGQGGPFRPYLGGGLGFGNSKLSGQGVSPTGVLLSDSGTGFAWHVGGGINIDLATATELEIGYRYLEVDGVNVKAFDGTKSSVDIGNHLVLVGLKYHF